MPLPNFSSRPIKETVVLFLLVAAYTLTFSWITISNHNLFRTHAMDLAIYDQIVWNTAHGRWFATSFYPGQSISLADHLSFIWLFLAPFYWLWSDPRMLLFLQSLAVALGAVPVYLLVREKLSNALAAFSFATAYLLFVPLQNANLFDVHEITFVPVLLLFAFYCLEKNQYKHFLASLILAMLTKEEVALTAAAFGAYILLFHAPKKLGALTFITSSVYFYSSINVIIPYFRGGPYGYTVIADYLGKSLWDKLVTLTISPLFVARNFFSPFDTKLEAFLHFLVPVGFLPLFGFSTWVLALPALAIKFLSNISYMWGIDFHYSAHLTPFLFITAISGLSTLANNRLLRGILGKKKIVYFFSMLILTTSFLMSYHFSALPWGKKYNPPRLDWQARRHIEIGYSFVKMIPENASVSAQTDLLPHLSQREQMVMFPNTHKAQYILLDTKSAKWPLNDVSYKEEVAKLLQGEEYGVKAEEDGYILFQKGLSSEKNEQLLKKFP